MVDARRAAAAGIFYPADREQLARVAREMIDAAPALPRPGRASHPRSYPRAIVVPHATWRASGATAAAAWARVAPGASRVKRVVLLGPSHHVPFAGVAAPFAETFSTPLGALQLDRLAIEGARRFPQLVVSDVPHDNEHAIEVQLPFMQVAVGAPAIVPLIVGESSDEEVAAVVDALWQEGTLVVVSTDLSHYYDADTAARLDGAVARAIESLDAGAIDENNACASVALRAVVRVARERGLRASTLDLRTSADSGATSREEVVGFGAFAFA